MDIFNLARLNGVLRYLLYLDTAPLPALRILLVILLTQNLDLRGDWVIAYLALVVVLLVFSQEILEISILLAIWLSLGVIGAESYPTLPGASLAGVLDWLLMSWSSLLDRIHNVKVLLMSLASIVLSCVKDSLLLSRLWLSVTDRLRILSLTPVSSWTSTLPSITTFVLLDDLLLQLKDIATLWSLRHGWSSSWRLLFLCFMVVWRRVSWKLLNQMSNTTIW